MKTKILITMLMFLISIATTTLATPPSMSTIPAVPATPAVPSLSNGTPATPATPAIPAMPALKIKPSYFQAFPTSKHVRIYIDCPANLFVGIIWGKAKDVVIEDGKIKKDDNSQYGGWSNECARDQESASPVLYWNEPDTNYKYQIFFMKKDQQTDTAVSFYDVAEFRTLSISEDDAPAINVNVSDITATSANIEWMLEDHYTTGSNWIVYGVSTDSLNNTSDVQVEEFKTDGVHYILDLTNLSPNTTYYFKAKGFSHYIKNGVYGANPIESNIEAFYTLP